MGALSIKSFHLWKFIYLIKSLCYIMISYSFSLSVFFYAWLFLYYENHLLWFFFFLGFWRILTIFTKPKNSMVPTIMCVSARIERYNDHYRWTTGCTAVLRSPIDVKPSFVGKIVPVRLSPSFTQPSLIISSGLDISLLV